MAAIIAAAAAWAQAADQCVNPGGTGGCFAKISDAITAAQPGKAPATITIAAGTYFESNIRLFGALSLKGAGQGLTFIDGTLGQVNQINPVLVTNQFDPSSNIISISDLTIQNGSISTPVNSSGGLLIFGGTTTLANVTVQNNTGARGGGILNLNGALTITDCQIVNNAAFGSPFSRGFTGGGGLFNSNGKVMIGSTLIANNLADGPGAAGGGIVTNNGSLTIKDSFVENNSATNSNPHALFDPVGGGGLAVRTSVRKKGAGLSVSNTVISGNSVSSANSPGFGGGVFYLFAKNIPAVSFTISNSTISQNTATDEGGGIAALNGPLTLDRDSVTNNSAGADGGGFATTTKSGTLSNSTFAGNQANGDGGGIAITASAGAKLTIVNSMIANNHAGGDGGGVAFAGGSLRLDNATVASNQAAGSGGGIAVTGKAGEQFSNTVIALNQAPAGADCSGKATSKGFNLLQNLTGCTITPKKTDITGQDPMLAALSDNGGPTETMALLAASPAINKGNPGANTGKGNHCEAADQRGNARPPGGCDIGAFEFP